MKKKNILFGIYNNFEVIVSVIVLLCIEEYVIFFIRLCCNIKLKMLIICNFLFVLVVNL